MLAHPLLALLVFEHGFIQIRFGIFDFFCFCFMSNKCFLILLNFTRYLFSVNTMNVQKQPPEVFCKKMCSWKFHKIHRKTPVPEAFFNKVVGRDFLWCSGLRPATLLKKRLWYRCFPVNFVKFPRTSFLQNTSERLLLNVGY